MKPECKRCLKKGSACWQHSGKPEDRKKRSPPKDERRCTAKTYASGYKERCKKAAILGGTVCQTHGGGAKQVKAAAAARLEEQRAIQAQATYGLPREVDPHTALLEEVHRTAGHVAWLVMVIQSYEDQDALAFGKGTQILKGDSWGSTPIRHAAPAVWLDLYARERRHLADVCKTAIACGIAERQVKLAEQHGEVIARVMKDFAKALAAQYGFDPEDAPVSKAARKVLVAFAGQAAA